MDYPNIILRNTCQKESYTGPQTPISRHPVSRNRDAHAAHLQKQLSETLASDNSTQATALADRGGTYLEFKSKANKELITKSLEDLRQGVRLLNIRTIDSVTAATVFIPRGKESFFLKKASEYADHAKDSSRTGNPKNNMLMASIEDVQTAILDSFWTGAKSRKPDASKQWVEIWLRTERSGQSGVVDSFKNLLCELDIRHRDESILFPERAIVLVHANRAELTNVLMHSGVLAEMREAPEATSFFEDLNGREQQDWIDDLLSRTHFKLGNHAICLLDTGINRAHPLLSASIDEDSMMTYDESWGTADNTGHGTGMAGIALYDDLKSRLVSGKDITLNQHLESVKVLQAGADVDPELYGDVAQRSVYIANATHPERRRVFCSAITATDDEITDGLPTSWSGAVDEAISHAGDDDNDRELFFVSAGNVFPETLKGQEYPEANLTRAVRSPGQAWNAVTVGAFSKDTIIEEQSIIDSGYRPVAATGELSPYSTTSVMWSKGAPIKPEILCDGGNMIERDLDYSNCSDLQRLTTGKDVLKRPLAGFGATSAAAAQAAYIAAELENTYPKLWPETIRGLMIHSARWSQGMMNQFCPDYNNATKKSRGLLLKTCGYGIPNLETAIRCKENSVNLIIQGTIQPFCKKGSRNCMNEMHVHKIPWPHDALESLGSAPAELRVTLSYYIEPGPGQIGWKDRYRYPSHGLRFDVNKSGETFEEFEHRINVSAREEEEGKSVSDSGGWWLGVNNRNVGSIHSDFKRANAIDLCETRYIAVYPVVGWWRERAYLERIESETRYSLIVSIATPAANIDLYTPIINQIEIANPAEKIAIPISAAFSGHPDLSNNPSA